MNDTSVNIANPMKLEGYHNDVKAMFDKLAKSYEYWKRKNSFYNAEIERFYTSIISPNKKVLEIGCATGALLNRLKPQYGLGLDISSSMIEFAKKRYPNLQFRQSTIEDFDESTQFDFIVISNLLEYVVDMYDFFHELHKKLSFDTKIIITSINPFWEPVIKLATFLRLRSPVHMKNFVTYKDIENILSITGYEALESGYRVFIPNKIPLLTYISNKLITRLPFLRNLSLVQYTIARPKQSIIKEALMSCTVVIPCYNEEENIEQCIASIPEMGKKTELLVVDDGSTDKTIEIVKNLQKRFTNLEYISYTPNRGKGYAVKAGLDKATGDILMILDADMAVLPRDMLKFYNVLNSRQAEFVNGTRMIYSMAPGAMRFINYLGNKFFGILISFIIGQRNTDALCGTKAFYKKDYVNFKMGKCPWGDFDLLFESARMKLKMIEMPVHYYPRMKGTSKMKVFKHGIQLLKMCWYGFWYLG